MTFPSDIAPAIDKPFLSLCVIVKDVGPKLRALLDSCWWQFDEIVVVDTGSTDETLAHLSGGEWENHPTLELFTDCIAADDRADLNHPDIPPGFLRIILAGSRFLRDDLGGVFDFATARQFAFECARGTWRMYLDSDDTFGPAVPPPEGKFARLQDTLRAALEKNPNANTLAFPYHYDIGTHQTVRRGFLWEQGWQWQDEVHEHCDRTKGQQLVTIPMNGFVVTHHKTYDEHLASTHRNAAIMRAVLSQDGLPENKQAKFAYHIGREMMQLGDSAGARHWFRQCIAGLSHTTYAVYALRDLVRSYVDREEFREGLTAAGEFIARFPSLPDGYAMAGWCSFLLDNYVDCCTQMLAALSREELPHDSAVDVWFTKGTWPAVAAFALATRGLHREASEYIKRVDLGKADDYVSGLTVRAAQIVKSEDAFQSFRKAFDSALAYGSEATATRLLNDMEDLFPRKVSSIADLRNALTAKTQHLQSFKEYVEAYSGIPESVYHNADDKSVLATTRAKVLLAWAQAAVPENGPRIRMYVIGYQDGIIERAVLEANPHIHMTLADVSDHASGSFESLCRDFPGRVIRHVLDDFTDHPQDSAFDVITAFEVMEHVPGGLMDLCTYAAPGTRLFVSVPDASKWIEYDRFARETSMWHVDSYSAERLFDIVRRPRRQVQGPAHRVSINSLTESHDGTLILDGTVEVIRGQHPHFSRNVDIVVPGTPNPFDATSPMRGFLGGSEEAVVFLAEALARVGVNVTVYTPQPMRPDGLVLRGMANVLYRPIQDWGPSLSFHNTVLLWRCPALLLDPAIAALPNVYLWLHDCQYSAPVAAYKAARRVLVLSEAHGEALKRRDGLPDDFQFTPFANGIVPEEFPELVPGNRGPKVIYASSPDRGLETVLGMWPEIRAAIPDATLDIYYDWKPIQAGKAQLYARLMRKLGELAGEGVTHHGGVSQPELHEAMRQASVWLYPTEGDVETFCITAVKMQACGVWPIVSSEGALPEVVLGGERFTSTPTFPEVVPWMLAEAIGLLRDEPSHDERVELRAKVLERFTWSKAAGRLRDMIEVDAEEGDDE